MPNWCDNSLYITGKSEDIKKLHEEAKEKGFFESVLPLGEWEYAKAIDTWGTKWEVKIEDNDDQIDVDLDLKEEQGSMSMFFQTAWGPALGVYRELAKRFCIEGYFIEPGVEFCGQFSNKEAGAELTEDSWDTIVDLTEEDMNSMDEDLKMMVQEEKEWLEQNREEDEQETTSE